jgi:serine/threonine protein kinase
VVLKQEYELLKYVRHDNIVQVYTFCENKGCTCLVLELCSDGNVEEYVRRQGPLPGSRARVLARQLIDAVDFLHCRRVVHRDVKPANLLLQHHAEVLKLADFHIARRLGTQSGSCLMMLSHRGTPLYCAPELRFDRQWNERVDIWAAGLSIFFMLRAALPFDGASRRANKLLKQGRMPPVVWGDMAEPPRNLLQQCFTVDMRDRPPALVLLLHPWLSDTLVTCSPGTADRQLGAFLPTCGILTLRAHGIQNVDEHARASFRAPGRAEALRHLSASNCARISSPGTRSNLTAVGGPEAWHTSPV